MKHKHFLHACVVFLALFSTFNPATALENSKEKATIVLSAEQISLYGESNFQLLLDSNCNLVNKLINGSVFPNSYADSIYASCTGSIPSNATYDASGPALHNNGKDSILVTPGQYDLIIISLEETSYGGTDASILPSEEAVRQKLEIVGGHTYHFHIFRNSSGMADVRFFPPVDLCIQEILLPENGPELNDNVPVGVRIGNAGNESIESFQIAYQIDKNLPVTQQIDQIVEPGNSTDVYFTQTADLSQEGRYIIKAWCSAIGDGNLQNDTAESAIRHLQTLQVPYHEDFSSTETFEKNFTILDKNQDKNTWMLDTSAIGQDGQKGLARIGISYKDALDDYLIAGPIAIPQGRNHIAFFYKANIEGSKESLDILLGNSSKPESMKSIGKIEDFENTDYLSCSFDFSTTNDSACFIALHATSAAYQSGICIDNLEIGPSSYTGQPDLAINKLILPLSSCALESGQAISAQISNIGTAAIENFSATYTINGQTTRTEEFHLAIPADSSCQITFAQTADFSETGQDYEITVEVWLPESEIQESRTDNNSLTDTVRNTLPIETLPYQSNLAEDWVYSRRYDTPETKAWDEYSSQSMRAYLPDVPLFSPCISLEGGTYRIRLRYRAGMTDYMDETYQDAFNLRFGIAGSPESTWTVLLEKDTYTQDGYIEEETTFSVPEAGEHTFCLTALREPSYLNFESFSIEKMVSHELRIEDMSRVMPRLVPQDLGQGIANILVEASNRGTENTKAQVLILVGQDTAGRSPVLDIAPDSLQEIMVKTTFPLALTGERLHYQAILENLSEDDSGPEDNTIAYDYAISDSTLAYDNASNFTESYTLGLSYGYGVGLPYTLLAPDTLTSISIGFGGISKACGLELNVYPIDMESGKIQNALLSLQTYRQAEPGIQTFQVPERRIGPGQYLFEVKQTTDTSIDIIVDREPEGAFHVLTEDGYHEENRYGYPCIRANFGESGPLSKTDLMLKGISSPSADSGLFSSQQAITVELRNNGYENLSGIVLNFQLNKETLPALTIEQLQAYSDTAVSFSVDMSAPGEYIVGIYTNHPGDENSSNDTLIRTFRSVEPADPYVMDFERCNDFAIEGFNPGWTVYDGDKGYTASFTDAQFPGSTGKFAFMAFVPEKTEPSMASQSAAKPFNGKKFGASFASGNAPNDDWLISPKLLLPQENAYVSFAVKSYTDMYGLEQYRVWISETGNTPEDFELIQDTRNAPAEDWKECRIDLSGYAGREVYIAFQCVSNDAFMFMLDNIRISKPGNRTEKRQKPDIVLWPNPASNTLVAASHGEKMQEIRILNLQGQEMFLNTNPLNQEKLWIDVSGFPSGMYMISIKTDSGCQNLKFIVN